MKRSQFIGGIICLLIAAVLVVVNLTLPPEDLMFQVGDVNMPWVPPVVLGIVGIILVVISFGAQKTGEAAEKTEIAVDPQREALNKRLETMAWGLFLVMLGGFMFVPEEIIKGGWWSIGVGLIMLGLNGARYYSGLRMSGFTTFLGIVSVIGGVLSLSGLEEVNGAILLVVLGGYFILKPWFERQKLFGKAEEGK